ncbi:MAG: HpcH/HpaI aldolase/citrate lyase family protein [Bacteroidales bacterium]|nr:HpcH/HpaI aldolase/citrate lyase family protein [Bacteroidales bacterium]
MSENIAYAGNKGENVRSDCFVTLELTGTGCYGIDIQSKVQSLYGESIRKLAEEILRFFEIRHARLQIEDTGALPLVIAARIEAALKELIDSDEEYLLPMSEENKYVTDKEQFRFSRLYLPGNTPKMMINAGIHQPNGIILDLEDSVAPNKKREARFLVRNALRGINFYGAERMVRINRFPEGFKDLRYIVPHNVQVILIPKCEGAEYVDEVENEIHKIKERNPAGNDIFLMPIIESGRGVENAFEIATASDKIVAMAIGLEDYTADIGAQRTQSAYESFYARSRIVNACRAARIQPIDSVFSDVGDEDGLKAAVKESKSLGFEGMGCIHPRQIRIIHRGFAPDEEEIEEAKKIVNASYESEEKGLGAVALGTKMIDPPVVKRAQKTLDLAIFLGLIPEDWRDRFIS